MAARVCYSVTELAGSGHIWLVSPIHSCLLSPLPHIVVSVSPAHTLQFRGLSRAPQVPPAITITVRTHQMCQWTPKAKLSTFPNFEERTGVEWIVASCNACGGGELQ